MSTLLNYIVWSPNLTMFHIGSMQVRWYGFCWGVGLLLAYFIVRQLYKHQKIKMELLEPLFIYCLIGILAGARLGHCLFYEPGYFLAHPIEMFLPIRMINGSWHYIGYEGLASHGGTLGLIIALWIYVRRTKLNIWHVLDDIAIATPITACFIRIGNLMNSEIVGKVTDVPWAFVFERVDSMPRHPGQLYEAIAYFVFFFIGLYLYKKYPGKVGTGFYFGFCLFTIFTFRFFVEYTKEVQEAFESSMALDMGQILSIPFIFIGIVCMVGGKWMKNLGTE